MIPHIGYLISSHVKYRRPLARLLASMKHIEKSRIFIAIGGGARDELTVRDGYLIAHATHNSYDHTAAIEFLALNLRFPEHLFFLHDTMEMSAQSEALIGAAAPEMCVTAASSLSGGGQCGLILCRRDYLEACRGRLEQFKNCTKREAIYSEGILWKECPPERRAVYQGETCEVAGATETFGGAARITEFYGAVAIRKFKANWGQDNDNGVVVP